MSAPDPIPPDTNYAPKFLITCGLFLVLAVGLCIARIYSRIFPVSRLSLDDWLIATAAILCVGSYITACINVAHGWGHNSYYVSPANRTIAFKCLFAQQIFWCFSTAMIRISVACSLLRLSTSKIWKRSLYTMIAVQILIYLGFLILLFGHVSPIRANWENVPDARRWDRKYEIIHSRVANPIIILVDVVLALMPIQLIRTLRRTLYEKILICSLMAMGLFAAVIAGYKMGITNKISKGDLLSTTVESALWNRLEGLVGLTAACMPCLKSPAERFLRRISILPKNAGLSKPSFVMLLEERHMKATKRSRNDTERVESIQICENVSREEMIGAGSDGLVSTAEDEYLVP